MSERKGGPPLRGNTLQGRTSSLLTGGSLEGGTSPLLNEGSLQGSSSLQAAGNSLRGSLTNTGAGLEGLGEERENTFPHSFDASPSRVEKIFPSRQLQIDREESSAWDSTRGAVQSHSGAAHIGETASGSLRGLQLPAPVQTHTASADSQAAYNSKASPIPEAAPHGGTAYPSQYNVPYKLIPTSQRQVKLPQDNTQYKLIPSTQREAKLAGDYIPSYRGDTQTSRGGNYLPGFNEDSLHRDDPEFYGGFRRSAQPGQSKDYVSSHKGVQLAQDQPTYHREYLSTSASDSLQNNTSIAFDSVTDSVGSYNSIGSAGKGPREGFVTESVGSYDSIGSAGKGHTDGFQIDFSSTKGKVFNSSDLTSPLQEINKRTSLRHLLSETDGDNSKAAQSAFDVRGKEYLNQSALDNAQNTFLTNKTGQNTAGEFALNQSSRLGEINSSEPPYPGQYKGYITTHDANTQGLSANTERLSHGLTDLHDGLSNDLNVSNGLYNKGLSYRGSGGLGSESSGFQTQSELSAANAGDREALHQVCTITKFQI